MKNDILNEDREMVGKKELTKITVNLAPKVT